MSPKQATLRKQLLAKIHMHKEYLYYKKHNAWQDFLTLRFEVKSSKDLSINELKILLGIFDGKIKDSLSFIPDLKGRVILKQNGSVKQFFYLKALLKQNKMNVFSFYRLCKKTLKKDVFSLLDLSKKDYTTMIVVLEKILKTEKK
ncbi:hypothetical protein [Campylobacter estrildidarum]|uniref:DUF1018 domain-containing protein n=1 Tax=Campylobacter estrildidarum TaxID=2510189 RepID=A0A4U7BLP3_9BACT|nr:hypothetical protein [Campylobacter estrildidarum]TKX29494.1 hypothetical protein CQA69_07275 [Campylobacter estrildidarum]